MKIFILLALLAVAFAQDISADQLHIPDKCEDVLAVKVCDRLMRTAETLKLKSEEVKKGLLDAYAKGKKTAAEIEASVEDFMVNKVLNKKCEDFTSVENCKNLRKIAAVTKVKAEELQKYILKQIATLKSKSCEDLLSVPKCKKIDDLSAQLKIKVNETKEMIFAALLEAQAKGTKHLEETYNKIKTYVMSTRCEDMFNPELCTSFRKYAEKTKVALPRLIETAFNLLKTGMSVSKALIEKVYNIADYFYDCTDIFDDSSCERIKNWAAKLKVKAEQVEVLIRKYVRVFMEKGTSVYQTIKDFVKERIYCTFKSCPDSSDDDMVAFVISKRSSPDEWKGIVLDILKNKFTSIEVSLRKYVEALVLRSKSIWQFMFNLAQEIKNNANAKYVEFLKALMIEATL